MTVTVSGRSDPETASPTPVSFTLRTGVAVGAVSASLIAYELFVMRIFSNGNWSHFGSMVISIAMFGFGLFSTILCIGKDTFTRRSELFITISLVALGPLMILANGLAQKIPFNPMFLVSDGMQRIYLLAFFLLYFLPFLAGAAFLGLAFLTWKDVFGRVYFANMAGSGFGGIVLFAAMYVIFPDSLHWVPLALWAIGGAMFFLDQKKSGSLAILALSVALSAGLVTALPQLVVSPYKGISYARNFPDAQLIAAKASPFGTMNIYASSYFHFAPGLSDNASMHLAEMPENAFYGMYIDGDGPIGIMKHLPEEQSDYFQYLPMTMPYLTSPASDVLIMGAGGGISSKVALWHGAKSVTVAEGNPLIIYALRDIPAIASFTGDILRNPKVRLVEEEGRIFVRSRQSAFDIIDLSLADSTGLSMAGGISIHENYAYTLETLSACLRALKPDGILAITVWNKEDPPKSAIKLLSTVFQAARGVTGENAADHIFVAHTYLSTLTVLCKRSPFSDDEKKLLRRHCKKMSFERIYPWDKEKLNGSAEQIFAAFRNAYFAPEKNENLDDSIDMSAGNLLRHAASLFASGNFKAVEQGYLFDARPLTSDRPYFAGYVHFKDMFSFLDKLESISDEWGHLLLWAKLIISSGLGTLLLLLPLAFGWRSLFAAERGKGGIVAYFLCLGLGYMLTELSLISTFMRCLGNPTVSFTLLITGMLIFSGMGSFASERFLNNSARTVIVLGLAIAAMQISMAWWLNPLFDAIGTWPYIARILVCLAVLFPLAFLMGFPFALGMGTLARLGKEQFFVWAWGINGSFSVVGAVLVPLIAVHSGLSSALWLAAAFYLLIIPAFLLFHQTSADNAKGHAIGLETPTDAKEN
ncbi:MAG: hypothetical protein KKB51_09840 [Candidatus Riflebacteria bacterium]|nr:hypothetical protein [Candidatus Riflebacteria bacterium]